MEGLGLGEAPRRKRGSLECDRSTHRGARDRVRNAPRPLIRILPRNPDRDSDSQARPTSLPPSRPPPVGRRKAPWGISSALPPHRAWCCSTAMSRGLDRSRASPRPWSNRCSNPTVKGNQPSTQGRRPRLNAFYRPSAPHPRFGRHSVATESPCSLPSGSSRQNNCSIDAVARHPPSPSPPESADLTADGSPEGG